MEKEELERSRDVKLFCDQTYFNQQENEKKTFFKSCTNLFSEYLSLKIADGKSDTTTARLNFTDIFPLVFSHNCTGK